MSQSTFNPTNELEEVLVRAASQPSARPEFFQKLFDSEIWLLTPDAPATSGRQTFETNTKIQFVNWRNEKGDFLPIFSSQAQLQEAVNRSGQTYGFLAIKGRDLFPVLAQHPCDVVLNPGAAYGKHFVPDEINRLGDGSFFKTNERVIQATTQILLGQPADYPHAAVKALQELFSKEPSVEAAYLAQMHDPSSGEPPHLIFGIKCRSNEYKRVITQAGITTHGLLKEGFADFVPFEKATGSLEDYFKKQTKPFYQSDAKKPFWKVW